MATSSSEQLPIRQIARYRVGHAGLPRALRAIREYVAWIRANEPGTLQYEVWQDRNDPTSFVHICVFRDSAADRAHSDSAALRKFTSIIGTEYVAPVEFLDYQLVDAET